MQYILIPARSLQYPEATHRKSAVFTQSVHKQWLRLGWILHASGLLSSDRSAAGSPWLCGNCIQTKQLCDYGAALTWKFRLLYREDFKEIAKYKDSKAMYTCLTTCCNVSATVSFREWTVFRPTQYKLVWSCRPRLSKLDNCIVNVRLVSLHRQWRLCTWE